MQSREHKTPLAEQPFAVSMTDTTRIGEMPFIKLPGRVMLPRATRLLRLRASAVREIAPALRSDRLLAVGVEHHTSRSMVERETSSVPQADEASTNVPICICKVVAVSRLSAGGNQLLIRGLSRGTRFSTRNRHEPWIEKLTENYIDPPTIDREHRCEELRQLLEDCVPGATQFSLIHRVLEHSALGSLCDLIADTVGMGGERGLQLLSTTNVDVRSDLLLDALREMRRQDEIVNWLTLVGSHN